MQHSDPHSHPWHISERDFPANGSLKEQLRFLLNYAILAPSKHNTQPWLFHIEDAGVELYADYTRILSVADAHGREMIMSCGAALANLLVALRYFKFSWTMELPTNPGTQHLLARLKVERSNEEPGEEERKLFFALLQRHTNRQAFQRRPVPLRVVQRLEVVARDAGASLAVVRNDEQRVELANLVLSADHALWADQQYRQELAQWIHADESPSLDGIPISALGHADISAYLGQYHLHTLVENTEQTQDEADALKPPVLAVLATVADTWFDWLTAGIALENVLLHARIAGLWASFFSQPTEVPTLRQALRRVLEMVEYPQIVLRLGYAAYGARVQTTPRRDVDDVVM